MPTRQLSELGDGSYGVRLPKDDLERDNLLEDGEITGDQPMWFDRLGEGVYLIRETDADGSVPAVEECEVVRRLAAELALERLDDARPPTPSGR